MHSAAPTDETEPAATAREAAFPRAFFGIVAMQFVFGLAVSTFTILPTVVVRHLRGNEHDVGLFSAVLAFGALVAAPVSGVLIDRVGRRTMILVGCASAGVASFLFATFLDVRALALPLLVVNGASFVLVVNGLSTLVADVAPRESLARAVGWQGAATMIANAVSPTIAEHFAPRFGWHAPFFAASAIVAVLCGMAYALPRDRRTEGEVGVARATPKAALRSLVSLLVVAFLAGAAFTTISTFQQPHLIARGASTIRDYFIGFSAGALLMRLGFGGLPDRVGLPRATRFALATYALVSFAFVWMQPSALVLGGLGHGLAHGVLYPTMVALAFRTVGPESRGLAASMTLGAFNGGSALAGVLLGMLARATSTSLVFVAGAACAWVAIGFVRDPDQRGTSTV